MRCGGFCESFIVDLVVDKKSRSWFMVYWIRFVSKERVYAFKALIRSINETVPLTHLLLPPFISIQISSFGPKSRTSFLQSLSEYQCCRVFVSSLPHSKQTDLCLLKRRKGGLDRGIEVLSRSERMLRFGWLDSWVCSEREREKKIWV